MNTLNVALVSPLRRQETLLALPATHPDHAAQATHLQTKQVNSVQQFLAALLRSLGTFAV